MTKDSVELNMFEGAALGIIAGASMAAVPPDLPDTAGWSELGDSAIVAHNAIVDAAEGYKDARSEADRISADTEGIDEAESSEHRDPPEGTVNDDSEANDIESDADDQAEATDPESADDSEGEQ